jgi:hypothetical protein
MFCIISGFCVQGTVTKAGSEVTVIRRWHCDKEQTALTTTNLHHLLLHLLLHAGHAARHAARRAAHAAHGPQTAQTAQTAHSTEPRELAHPAHAGGCSR